MSEPVTLSPADASEMLGIKVWKLREYKRRGLITYLPICRGGRYRVDDVLAFRDSMARRNGAHRPATARTATKTTVPDWLVKARAEGQSAGLTSGKQAAS
jgi:hypothetical protein